MAFDHFSRERVDVAIVEVGLGGRLDSTNVITPLLSVITNISYDHQNMLGDTLPQIAFEKAGIIKPGVPVVIGETHPESAPVFLKKAAETGSEIVFADQNFRVSEKDAADWHQEYRISPGKENPGAEWSLEVDAAGPYQSRNLATVLQSVEIMARYLPAIDRNALREGLKNLRSLTRFMGRWQIIGQNPTVLCDSAHNEAGLRLAFERIDALVHRPPSAVHRPPYLHIVTGFVNDKDVDKVLGYFPRQARYYFAKANIPRGLEAAVLKDKAAGYGLEGRAYSSVRNALKAAKRAAAPDDLIVVTGSIFVVAEVL
jgi:dihydrofolate synthase/folylpolyglutamate synthase